MKREQVRIMRASKFFSLVSAAAATHLPFSLMLLLEVLLLSTAHVRVRKQVCDRCNARASLATAALCETEDVQLAAGKFTNKRHFEVVLSVLVRLKCTE
jgi:hypothetical protein